MSSFWSEVKQKPEKVFSQIVDYTKEVSSHVFSDIQEGDAYNVSLYSKITDVDGNEMRSEVVSIVYQPSIYLGLYHLLQSNKCDIIICGKSTAITALFEIIVTKGKVEPCKILALNKKSQW